MTEQRDDSDGRLGFARRIKNPVLRQHEPHCRYYDDSCDETHWDAVSGGTDGVYSLASKLSHQYFLGRLGL